MDRMEARLQFSQLYDATYPRVFAYTLSRIRDLHDTDDLLQTVYAAFYRRILSKGPPQDETAALKLLFTSARHELGRYYGYRKREQETVRLDDGDAVGRIGQELAAPVPEPFTPDALLLDEIWEQIAAKGDLTERLFILHFRLGLTLAQCAGELGISVSMATSRIYRTIHDIQAFYRKGGEGA